MIRGLILFCLLMWSVNAAIAQSKTATVSTKIYKQLMRSNELLDQKKYAAAHETLKNALAKSKKNSFERATVLRALSSVHAVQSAYVKAAQYLSKAVALKTLPDDQQQQAILNLGQLYLASQQYKQAVQTLKPWLAKTSSVDTELLVLMANAYAQLKQYPQALIYIQKAIEASKKPQEQWFQLNLALYYELKKYHSAAKLLQRLIKRYPTKHEYWDQLSSVYLQQKKFKKAASIKHLALVKGISTGKRHILSLIELMVYVGSPYKAAKVMESALNSKKLAYNSANLEKLANIWLHAKEYGLAVKALKKASALHAKGELYQRLGQLFVEQEEWQQAVASFKNALNKGGLKQAGKTHLLLGISYYEQGKYSQAEKSFRQAQKYAGQRKKARQWLTYLQDKA